MKSENQTNQKKQSKSLPTAWEQGWLDAEQCQMLRRCSHAHHHKTVREGKFPAPAIRAPRYTRWRGSEVKAYLDDPQGWLEANVKQGASE